MNEILDFPHSPGSIRIQFVEPWRDGVIPVSSGPQATQVKVPVMDRATAASAWPGSFRVLIPGNAAYFECTETIDRNWILLSSRSASA